LEGPFGEGRRTVEAVERVCGFETRRFGWERSFESILGGGGGSGRLVGGGVGLVRRRWRRVGGI